MLGTAIQSLSSFIAALLASFLIHGDLFRLVVRIDGFFEKSLGSCEVTMRRQEKTNGLAFLIAGAIEVLPNALHLDVGSSFLQLAPT